MRNSWHIDHALHGQARQWVVRRQLWHERHRQRPDPRISLPSVPYKTRVSPAGTPVSLPVPVIETTIAGVSMIATTPAPNVLAS